MFPKPFFSNQTDPPETEHLNNTVSPNPAFCSDNSVSPVQPRLFQQKKRPFQPGNTTISPLLSPDVSPVTPSHLYPDQLSGTSTRSTSPYFSNVDLPKTDYENWVNNNYQVDHLNFDSNTGPAPPKIKKFNFLPVKSSAKSPSPTNSPATNLPNKFKNKSKASRNLFG